MDWLEVIKVVGPLAGAVVAVVVLFIWFFLRVSRSAMKFYGEQTANWQDFFVGQAESWKAFTSNHLSATTQGLETIGKTLGHLCERQERIDNLVTGCPRRRKTDLNGDE